MMLVCICVCVCVYVRVRVCVCEREGNVEGDFCISENDRDIERLLSYLRKLLEKINNCVPRLMQWDKILLRKFRGCSTAKN